MSNEKSLPSVKKDKILITEKTKELTNAIKESGIHARYQNALRDLKEHKSLFEKYNEFQKKNILLELNKSENYDTEIEKLYADYNDLIVDPFVSEYLTAQQSMCRMVNDVIGEISRAVDMDLTYFEE